MSSDLNTKNEFETFMNFLQNGKEETFEVRFFEAGKNYEFYNDLKKFALENNIPLNGTSLFIKTAKDLELITEKFKYEAKSYIGMNPKKELRANADAQDYWKHIEIDLDTKVSKEKTLLEVNKVTKYMFLKGFYDHLCIDSGNGYHLIYRLNGNVGNDFQPKLRVFLEDLSNIIDKDIVKIDPLINLDRVIAYPGSYNLKDKPILKKLVYVEEQGNKESLSDFIENIHVEAKVDHGDMSLMTDAVLKRIDLFRLFKDFGMSNIDKDRIECPYHDSVGKMSVQINDDGTFKCHGCGKSGNAIHLYMKFVEKKQDRHIDYITARKEIMAILGITKESIEKTAKECVLNDRVKSLMEGISKDIHQFNIGLDPTKWIIKDIMPEKGIVVLGGSPASMKSWIAMSMAASLANGKDIFGNFSLNGKERKVLYIDEENGSVPLYNRMKRISNGLNKKEKISKNFIPCVYKGIRLGDSSRSYVSVLEDNKKIFRELINNLKPDVVILDSLVRIIEGDENSVADVRLLFDTIKDIKEELNVSFIIIHHTRKDNTNSMNSLRGSGDLSGMADTVIMIQNPESEASRNKFLNFRVVKNRHSDKYNSFAIKVDENLVEDGDGRKTGEIKFTYFEAIHDIREDGKEGKRIKAEGMFEDFCSRNVEFNRKDWVDYAENYGISRSLADVVLKSYFSERKLKRKSFGIYAVTDDKDSNSNLLF